MIQLTGIIMGTTGSWHNLGNTVDKVFDGNLGTYFDAPTGNDNWAGLDLGQVYNIEQIKFCPRTNYSNRILSGKFQGSNTADFTAAIDLYTVSSIPTPNALTSINVSGQFRYVRYLSPPNSNGNIAEMQIFGSAINTGTFKLVLGVDGDNSLSQSWVPPTTPATIHVNAFTDFVEDVSFNKIITITATDQSGHIVDTLHNFDDSFVFENAGQYTITAQVNTLIGSATVNIAANTRNSIYIDSVNGNDTNNGSINTPLKSFARLPKLIKNSTAILLKRGSKFNMTTALSLSGFTDILVDCYGDATQPLPKLYVTSGTLISFWTNSKNITIRKIRLDSAWTWASANNGYAYHQAKAYFGTVRGTNITLSDLELENLSDGITTQTDGVNGILIQNCNQIDPIGIAGRNVFINGGSDVVIRNNTMLNSINESPFRVTANGAIRGSAYGNNISQQLDPEHGRTGAKAGLTFRQGMHFSINNNIINNSDLSIDHGGASGPNNQSIQYCSVNNNKIIGGKLAIRSGSINNLFSDNEIHAQNYECIAIDAEPNANNIVKENQMYGLNSGIKFYTPSKTFVQDNTFHTSSNLPIIKGNTSAMVDLGGNTVKP